MQQRYSTSSGGGISNNSIGGPSIRDNARVDSSFSSSNFNLTSRRPSQLTPYKLKCEKEPLASRLGPPDFFPQTPNCPEETLTREYLQSGYKETVEGIEEAKEIVLTQAGALSKPIILRCKEAIRKHLRAINETRALKRKAGQSYGVPLSGQLIVKPGLFPDLRSCGEDSKKKWIEGLSQYHKGLRSLAYHVPHGYRKKILLEVIIRHNVPLLRATWFIKVTYLNQVRPNSAGLSSGTPDKSQPARTELWTKDVIEYLQYLLDDLFPKNGPFPSSNSRDQSPQSFLSVPHQRTDLATSFSEGEEPSLQFKWQYMTSLINWHYTEGLLSPSLIIEWVLIQLQEKESVDMLELLLPIIISVIDTLVLSQTYVRMLVDIAIHSLHDLYPGGMDHIANAKKPHLASALVEVVRYLLLVVPDTFVALDCFPLPISVAPDIMNGKRLDILNGKNSHLKIPEGADTIDYGLQDSYHQYLSFGQIASSLQRRASNLAKIANPSPQGHGVAKLLQALDRALLAGDVKGAYGCLFEDLPDSAIEENWIAEVSPYLRASLKWIGAVSLSVISAVFFLLEWATCDFRDYRTSQPFDVKFTGKKDFSQVYMAVLLLKLKADDMHVSCHFKNSSFLVPQTNAKNPPLHEGLSGGATVENASLLKACSRGSNRTNSSDVLQTAGPLHDVVICWLDQHEVAKGEGFKRLEVLIMELIRHGIFNPQAYVRQLIVSGIMDRSGTSFDLDRQQRHARIIKQLPGSFLFEILEESKIAEVTPLRDIVHDYSNERKLVLHGIHSGHSFYSKSGVNGSLHENHLEQSGLTRDGASPSNLANWKNTNLSPGSFSRKHAKLKYQVTELKVSISALLHLPPSCLSVTGTHSSELQGSKKRPFGLLPLGSKFGMAEGTPGCEECTRAKRHKIGDERVNHIPGFSSSQSDDEDIWWMRKGSKSLESVKDEQHFKSTKTASRGRQKSVRKTQSLAQLAAARIEGSQGTSTSHVCENKASCPHHLPGAGGESLVSIDGMKTTQIGNIGRTIKKLRWVEKRCIAIWLTNSVRQLIEGNENTASRLTQSPGPFSPLTEERSVVRWKLGEEELSSILYLLDISSDLYLAVKFLIWLFPRVIGGALATHLGRNAMMLPKNNENYVTDVGEAFILASFQRYESVLVSMDLIPEALSAAMHRAAATVASNGRTSGSLAFIYARNLLRKYGKITSVTKWEKGFRATCDQRLLAEFETGRSLDAELGYSLGVTSGVEDDDYIRQKVSGRASRAVQSMKEIVQKHVEEAVNGKEKKVYGPASSLKMPILEKWDDVHQTAQQIVVGLLDCMRQNRGAAQEWDPSLVAAAIFAIVGNVGPACSNYQNSSSATNSLNCVQRIVHVHIACLCLLKEALGERLNRVFEIALATEASSIISGAFAPIKTPRGQFQFSPEIHDVNQNIGTDAMNNYAKMIAGKALKAPASVSALVVGAIVHGVSSLERMITAFRLKEGLDFMQFVRSTRSSANGISRSIGNFKLDHGIEVYIHWFRLLVGNCRTVFDGLVVDILGDSYTLALCRMQRMLPLTLSFPLAYSIFAMVIWRPYILNSNIATREDLQLYQYLSVAIGDIVKLQSFRDLCLRDTQAFYDLMVSDVNEPEFAAMLELHSPDKHLKRMAFVPLRARLFLNAIVDCRMPPYTIMKDDGSLVSGLGEPRRIENETKLHDQLVHVLDTLQPAKFHWQWVELRLLLNEQALIERIESTSLVEAIRSLSPTTENFLSENENTFVDVVLTRLLIRPDAASLYSEVFRLLGRSLEEKLLLHVKWFLGGSDVLLGRKSVRQRLVNMAQQRGLSTKPQYWKPWGWSSFIPDVSTSRGGKRKSEVSSLEEGEVVDDGPDTKRSGKSNFQAFGSEGLNTSQHYVTDKALAELVLPCIDRSSAESRNLFATDLIKQLSTIDQHISTLIRGAGKQNVSVSFGVDGPSSKTSTRKGIRGGSPGLGRRSTGTKDSSPPSIAALRASIWLRLQFLLRLLPVIYADREQPIRNLRHAFTNVLFRLLGTQVVYEDADALFTSMQRTPRRDVELVEASLRPMLDLSCDSLFDRLLSVLYGLISGCRPSWLKIKSASKSKSSRDFPVVDRELIENLQADLEQMQLPAAIRQRLQSALPVLPPLPGISISCQPPVISSKLVSSLHPHLSPTVSQEGISSQPQRTIPSARSATSAASRSKPLLIPDSEIEIDPWTLLEDGTGSVSASSSSSLGGAGSDHSNLKACYWLKGAVRMRRTDITYVGTMDDDS